MEKAESPLLALSLLKMDDETAEIELVGFIVVMDHISQTRSPTASAEFE